MPNWCACELTAEGTDATAFTDGFRAAFASPGNYGNASAMIQCDEHGARHVDAVQTPFAGAPNEFSLTPDGKQRIQRVFEPESDIDPPTDSRIKQSQILKQNLQQPVI